MHLPCAHFRSVRINVAWLCVLWLCPWHAVGQDPLSRVETDRVFLAELNQLAASCDQEGLDDLAGYVRDWFIPRGLDRQYLFSGAPQDCQSFAEDRRERFDEFQQLRSRQADRLWKLAEQAAVEGELASAVQLMYEILHERPDDERARRGLGLRPPRKPGDPPLAKLARHPQQALGWPAGRYWRLSTDHFSISTNHSGEAAQELATVLEDFYTLWRQLFVDYWASPAAVRQAVNGRGLPRISAARHRVVLFRSREEYVGYLRRIEPQAEMTLGIYRDADRLAYFFAGEEVPDVQSTWRHEIAHQLFQETRRREPSVGEAYNFWLVEGIALYLESQREFTDYYTVGGIDAERLQFARYRALNESFYIPLAELSVLGRVALQQDPRIRRIYSQAAGLTHFFMDGQRARFAQP